MRLFGFEFKRETPTEIAPSFAPKESDDGAVVVAAGGAYGTYVDLDGTVRTEAELVTKYREMSLQPEIDAAVDEIINEAIDISEQKIVNINLDDLDEVSAKIKNAIRNEFQTVLMLLDFNRKSYEIFRRWYIDGRLYYHVVIDERAIEEGIKELRYIDPRKIRKVREVAKKRVPGGDTSEAVVPRIQNEYYIYNDKGFNYGNKTVGPSTTGLKIARDSIVHTVSGLTDTQGTMVLSYLHKAIKALNQLRTLEDALVIYRLARAPERRIWYIDVGNLPKMKAEQYVRDIMIKHKNRLIYDGNTGEVRDDRKFMCYAMDTKIPLLDGRTLELQQIIEEYNAGKNNWVYSCDPVTGKFYPGPVSWAGVTKENVEVVRVTFDNGKSVVCTPDHKFPVWNKGFVEAQHLTSEDSIIPGYRRMSKIGNTSSAEYEQIFKNDTKTWEFTHREVSNWKKEVGLYQEYTYNEAYLDASKSVVHHRDFHGKNNNPENLVYMNHKDHQLFHKENQSIQYTNSLIEFVKSAIVLGMNTDEILIAINCNETLMHEWRSINHNKNPKNRDTVDLWLFTYNDLVRTCKCDGYNTWREFKDSYSRIEREQSGRRKRGINTRGSDGWKQLIAISASNRKPYSKTWKVIDPNGNTDIIENLSLYCRDRDINRSNIKGPHGSKGYRAEELRNHRIVSVEKLSEKITVGSMSIDTEETYHSHHTYLLDAGVYTKNTMLEDYWLPRREGGRGTEVTTLPGGQTLGEMDDVLYFQKKLYQTLNVPVNRLNSDALFSLGRATEVTRDELKFGKFITRVRSRFSALFNSILEKQLVLKGIMSTDDWHKIANKINYDYARDNYFTELKNAEIYQNRAQLLMTLEQGGIIGKYYSYEWVRRNVLQQSDDDIEKQDEQIAEEQDSDDPRWAPPVNLEDPNANPDASQQMPSDPRGGSSDESDEQVVDDDSPSTGKDDNSKVREAQKTIDAISKISPKQRTMQDEAKFRSAVQIVARNK